MHCAHSCNVLTPHPPPTGRPPKSRVGSNLLDYPKTILQSNDATLRCLNQSTLSPPPPPRPPSRTLFLSTHVTQLPRKGGGEGVWPRAPLMCTPATFLMVPKFSPSPSLYACVCIGCFILPLPCKRVCEVCMCACVHCTFMCLLFTHVPLDVCWVCGCVCSALPSLPLNGDPQDI